MMGKHINRILAAAVLATGVAYAFLVIDASSLVSGDHTFGLLVWFHSVPCFFLQLLVCRVAGRAVARLIPVFLLLGPAACFAAASFITTGWNSLGWGFLLCLCIAPAVAYALAWAVYGIQRACQHNNNERCCL